MRNHLYIVHGDISELAADAIAYSTSPALGPRGDLYSAFDANVPGFAHGLAALRAQRADIRPGHTYWMPLPAPVATPGGPEPLHRPRGVAVVISVGLALDYEALSQLAVRGAIEAALEHLEPPPPGERLLVALPTFLLGQGGGRDHVLSNARAQVEAAAELLASYEGRAALDVAFVAYTPSNYHAYLSARRGLAGHTAAVLGDEAEALVEALRRRECVLFVGAGLSVGAGLRSWEALVATLEQRLGIDPAEGRRDLDYYLDLAQWYRERATEAELEPVEVVLRRQFGPTRGVVRPTLAHYLLLALPARHVITTNYDDLIERTMHAVGRPHVKVRAAEDIALTGRADRVCVVKFHGDGAGAGDVVISRDDYDAFFHNRPAMALLLEGLLLNQTFFFLGYSLRDPNFRQVYNRIALMLRGAQRTAYAATLDTYSDLAKAQWRNKQLRLITPEGEDVAAREHGLMRWLDALGEAVAREPTVFLAPDADATAPRALRELRARLMAVGSEVERLTREPALAADDVALLARTLGLLSELGFRPESRQPLSRLWERLARALPADATARGPLLAAALSHTENQADTDRLRAALAASEAAADEKKE